MQSINQTVLSQVKIGNIIQKDLQTLDFSLLDTIPFVEPCVSSSVILDSGIYLLQAWGSSGGVPDGYTASKGGYSAGILKLYSPINMIITVGSKGKSVKDSTVTTLIEGGCNGGGNGLAWSGNGNYYHSSGGGATDFRLIDNTLSNRVLVAGGAGGSPYSGDANAIFNGGYGGGEEGATGADGTANNGRGGSQTEPGLGCVDLSLTKCTAGSFGQGGSRTTEYGDGGGGGWFGGASSLHTTTGPGGGSGFVYTNLHPNNNLPDTYFLTDAKTLPNVWTGDGLALITKLKGPTANICHCKISKDIVLFFINWMFFYFC